MIADISIEFINLGIKLKDLPKGINIGGFNIAFYGIIIGFAMLVGTFVSCNYANRSEQKADDYIDLALWLIIACVIGARIYYVAFKWDYYKENPVEIINLRGGGLAIYGAVLMGMIVCLIYGKIKKTPYLLICDTAILGVVIGQAIGRWGNFFNREAFGTVCSNKTMFAMRLYFDKAFTVDQVPDSVLRGMLKMTGENVYRLGYVQVHPTFLYESIGNLCLFALLIYISKKKKFDGQIFFTYLLGYGVIRFFVEGLRTDQLQIGKTGIAVSQVLSVVLVVASVSLSLIFVNAWAKKKMVTINGRPIGTKAPVTNESEETTNKETAENNNR